MLLYLTLYGAGGTAQIAMLRQPAAQVALAVVRSEHNKARLQESGYCHVYPLLVASVQIGSEVEPTDAAGLHIGVFQQGQELTNHLLISPIILITKEVRQQANRFCFSFHFLAFGREHTPKQGKERGYSP